MILSVRSLSLFIPVRGKYTRRMLFCPPMMTMTMMTVHIAVFLITLSGLIFEIGLTRIYSATIWYHYAFVAISVALLGWGLGGVALHLLRRFVMPTIEKAALLVIFYAAGIVACLWLIVEFPFRLERLPL